DARKRGMGIVGMKVYFRGLAARLPWYDSMEPFFHFALSQPITTAVVGCDSVAQLEENVRYAESFSSISEERRSELIRRTEPYARSLMYYKP
ncbi:MAG: aldo/keto reductase, partial [Pseudomonadota bacterium]